MMQLSEDKLNAIADDLCEKVNLGSYSVVGLAMAKIAGIKAMQNALLELANTTVEINVYDEVELHENCTVEILRNSITGEQSIGWWENAD